MSLSGTSIVSRGPPAKSSAVRHAHGTFPAHRQALVLYGSETGNAQEAAEDMGRMLQRLHFDTPVLCLDAVEPDTIANTAIVLIAISTAGQGEFPRNSRRLWNKLLRRNLPPLLMKDVNFAIFGLGDSSYPQFNFASIKLQRRLKQLCAVELVPRLEGDDRHPDGWNFQSLRYICVYQADHVASVDALLQPWLLAIRKTLLTLFPLDPRVEPIPDDANIPPQWILTEAENPPRVDEHERRFLSDIWSGRWRTQKPSGEQDVDVFVVKNQRLTRADHFQDTRQIIFRSESVVSYEPGDVLVIYPENAVEDVDTIIELMGWQDIADKLVHYIPNPQHPSQPVSADTVPVITRNPYENITLRALLTKYLDLNAVPRRSFFSLISHYTKDAAQKQRLQEFANPELREDLWDYTTRPRRNILEVLEDFRTVRIPWQAASAVLPVLRGRQFSIASGGQLKKIGAGITNDDTALGKTGTRFDLLVAIVEYKTVMKKVRRGVCTRYLASLPVGAKIRTTLIKGTLGFTKAETFKKALVMVATGTGVAPMRALAWERLLWSDEEKDTAGKAFLIFGIRMLRWDYYFQREWSMMDLLEECPFSHMVAESRPNPVSSTKPAYVQHIISGFSCEQVFDLLYTRGGILCVCGSSGKMPLAVREALREAFAKGFLGLGPNDKLRTDETTAEEEEKIKAVEARAEAYIKTMEKEGRYKQETW